MDSSTDSTVSGADMYTKRWEPHEERDAGGDVYDELAWILLEDEESRKVAVWFDGRPVFPRKAENTVGAGGVEVGGRK